MRAIQRLFGVSCLALIAWLKKVSQLPKLEQTLLPAQEWDELGLDEMWSFVGNKKRSVWLFSALCHRTRQIVAFVLGDGVRRHVVGF